MAQPHETSGMSINAGPSVPVDVNAGLPRIYAGRIRGWVPFDMTEPDVKTNGGSISKSDMVFLERELQGAYDWHAEENYPLAPENWGDSSWGNGHWDADNRAELQVDGQNPAGYVTTLAFRQEIDVVEREGLLLLDEGREETNGRVSRGQFSERDAEVLARTSHFVDTARSAEEAAIVVFDGQNQEADNPEGDSSVVTPRTPRPDKHTKRSVRLGQEEDHRHLRLAIASKARDVIKLVRASGERIKIKKPTPRPQLKAWQHVVLDRGQSLRPLRSSGAGVDNLGREASKGEVVRFLRTQEWSQLRQEPLIARTTYQALEQPLGPRDRSTYFGQFGDR